MKRIAQFTCISSLALAVALAAGCATDSSQTASADTPAAAKTGKSKSKYNPVANPSKVKLGEFKRVEIKPTTLDAKHADHKGNQESAAKIDGMLLQQLRLMYADVAVLPAGAEFSKPAERTLQIAPHIKDIRLISGGTRFWLGAMAGGSDMLLQTTFRDSASGEVIADPEFAASNNAWSGGWTMGATDNQIRDNVVREMMGYMAANR